MVANSKLPVFAEEAKLTEEKGTVKEMMKIINHHPVSVSGSKVVAIASSTGGPKSLQSVIPLLPANLDAPVLVVQHMPVGFTASLAERLDNLSQLHVKEAAEGEELKKGWVYIAMGGKHLNVVTSPLDAIRCICRRNLTGKVSDPVPIICMSPCRPAALIR